MASVLIVDDDPVIRGALVEYFTNHHWHTRAAANGQDALNQLDESASDAVVLDLDMPVLDGHETLRRIRNRPELDDVCVAILTGRGQVDSAVTAIRQGAYQYLQKPFKMESLSQLLIPGIAKQKAQALQLELLSGLDVDRLLSRICSILMQVMRPDSLSVILLNSDGTVRVAKRGTTEGGIEDIDINHHGLERRFVREILDSHTAVLAEHDAHQRGSFLPEAKSLAAAPIPAAGGSTAGIIDIESSIKAAFDRTWLDTLKYYAGLIGIAISIDRSKEAIVMAEVWQKLPRAARELGHRISTPIHILGFQVDTLQSRELMSAEFQSLSPELQSTVRERVEIMADRVTEVTNACRLLRDITQEVPLHKEHIDLSKLVARCVNEYRGTCEADDIELTCDGALQLPEIITEADLQLVGFSIQCLLCNAREAIREKRRLYDSGEWKRPPEAWKGRIQARVILDAAAEEVLITIEDSGTGIRPSDVSRLFQPLFTTKRQDRPETNSNAGIALFSVKRIMTLHRGRVEVTNQWTQGATFRLYFPCQAVNGATRGDKQ